MTDQQRYSRRRLLVASGGALSTVAIAGCTGAPTADEANGPADDTEGSQPDATDDDESGGSEEDVTDDSDDAESEGTDEEFVDLTGEDEVTVITREGDEDEGEGSFVFDPAFVRVDAGTTIEWENTDGVFHTVTSSDDIDERSGGGDVFDETLPGEGDIFEWTAEETGEQPYYCSPHAGFMYGSIEIV